jgi:hypothetical protein
MHWASLGAAAAAVRLMFLHLLWGPEGGHGGLKGAPGLAEVEHLPPLGIGAAPGAVPDQEM